MKYLPLLWSSLWRKKLRTIFTLLSIFVAFLLFGYLMAERTGDSDAPWHLKPAPSEERTPRGKRGPLPRT